MTPSIKTLEKAFPGKGKDLRALLDGSKDPIEYSNVADWVAKCHHDPSRIEQTICAVDQVIDGFGTLAIFGDRVYRPDMEYVDMGDSYTTTIIYDYIDDRYMVTSYGDWIEWRESKGLTYE